MSGQFSVSTVKTSPIDGQKTGTSGLRKKVSVVQQDNFIENWLQSLFLSVKEDGLAGATLVVGGDGRYYNKHVLQIILKMAAANGVGKIVLGQDGLFSTPAVSAIIRARKAFGGIILTASHNPGGKDGDFGIKYNIGSGGPAPESVTSKIFAHTKSIGEYSIAQNLPEVDLSAAAVHTFANAATKQEFVVEVVDSVDEYLQLMKKVFDFEALKPLFARKDFRFAFDGLHGVAGPYAKRIFVDELGASADSLANCEPSEDFGGHHPDPNLTYAADLVALMKAGKFDFGAASDGDADRNMVLGNKFFVNPSDSVAVIAAHAAQLPFYGELKAVARSMPTSAALDLVAKDIGVELYEVPTGWKFFGNIMDHFEANGSPNGVICGEESFGTGSSHIREKDGLWAVLAWLSIVALHNKDSEAAFVSVEDIVQKHWRKYGRNYFSRYDYEQVSSESANKLMAGLTALFESAPGSTLADGFVVKSADNFEYTDKFDGSVTQKQGIRFVFEDGSRFVFRLSGTGSSGATIRLYVERYVANDSDELFNEAQVALKPIIELALKQSKLESLTGRKEPTVIT